MSGKRQNINTVFIDCEIHISHYDNEGFASIEFVGDGVGRILQSLGAQRVNANRYRLPVAKLGEFCDCRFGVQRVGYRKPAITDAQREARRENMRRAQAKRWAVSNG